jgi:hypothetical protein
VKLTSRVRKLEARVVGRPEEPDWPDEDAWLQRYAAWGTAGAFDHEPDFPVALAACHAALTRARLSVDPPWVPPDEFEFGADRNGLREAVRRQNWRHRKFPEAVAALEWLHEMRHRKVEGIPPVTEAEFAELAGWLESNAARLDRLADRNSPELLDVGRVGRSVHPERVRSWMVRFDLRAGARAAGSGRCAEIVRRLRSLFPGMPTE